MGAVSNNLDRKAGNDDGARRGGGTVALTPEKLLGLQQHIAKYRGTFDRLLPSHIDAETFVGIAAGALSRSQDLAAAALASPESLLVALRDCARLGHQPGTDQYALTVRKDHGRPAVLGIEQYQGVIERMFRAGAVISVQADVVCAGEVFIPQGPNPPLHRVPGDDWLGRDKEVKNLIGAYAYAVLEGSTCSRVVVMGRAEIMRHRDVAATTKIWDGPFGQSMWLKTVCHELEKWVPTSSEYRREQARAAAEMATAVKGGAAPSAAPAPAMPPTVDGSWVEHAEQAATTPDEPAAAPEPPAVEGDITWPETTQPPADAE